MGGGGLDVVGNVASPVASLGCGGASVRRESRHSVGDAFGVRVVAHAAFAGSYRVFGGRVACVPGAVDTSRGAGAGGVAGGAGDREHRAAAVCRTVSGARFADYDPGNPRVW